MLPKFQKNWYNVVKCCCVKIASSKSLVELRSKQFPKNPLTFYNKCSYCMLLTGNMLDVVSKKLWLLKKREFLVRQCPLVYVRREFLYRIPCSICTMARAHSHCAYMKTCQNINENVTAFLFKCVCIDICWCLQLKSMLLVMRLAWLEWFICYEETWVFCNLQNFLPIILLCAGK